MQDEAADKAAAHDESARSSSKADEPVELKSKERAPTPDSGGLSCCVGRCALFVVVDMPSFHANAFPTASRGRVILGALSVSSAVWLRRARVVGINSESRSARPVMMATQHV